MGMFDYVKCSYPLPGDPPAFVKATWPHEFQTKDMPNPMLDHYEITAEGRLFLESRDVNFDGALNFYSGNAVASGPWGPYTKTGEDAEWVEYCARFAQGTLVRIEERERSREPAH